MLFDPFIEKFNLQSALMRSTFWWIRFVQERSVLDILAEQADDFGSEDLSMNFDHYRYGLPTSTRNNGTE